jgi:hypothetical protein
MLNIRLLGPTSLGRPVEQGLRKGVVRLPKLILRVYVAFQEASEVCVPRPFQNAWAASRLSGCIFPQPTLYSSKLQNPTETRTSPHTHTRTQPRARQTQAPTQKASSNDSRPQAHQPQDTKSKKKPRRGTRPQQQGNTTGATTKSTTAQQTRPSLTNTLKLRVDCARIATLLTPELS